MKLHLAPLTGDLKSLNPFKTLARGDKMLAAPELGRGARAGDEGWCKEIRRDERCRLNSPFAANSRGLDMPPLCAKMVVTADKAANSTQGG